MCSDGKIWLSWDSSAIYPLVDWASGSGIRCLDCSQCFHYSRNEDTVLASLETLNSSAPPENKTLRPVTYSNQLCIYSMSLHHYCLLSWSSGTKLNRAEKPPTLPPFTGTESPMECQITTVITHEEPCKVWTFTWLDSMCKISVHWLTISRSRVEENICPAGEM